MTEKEIKRKLARAVLNNWRVQHSPLTRTSFFGYEQAPSSSFFVSCMHCEQAGAINVSHDDDCPVRIARNILRGKK